MAIHIGIGGWIYEPWRGTFYPADLPQKRELEYAASQLTGIEINGTYYGAQKPDVFRKWRDETPDGFVFALKGIRYATNRRNLAESQDSVERFLNSGLIELKDRLGPINWQFMATKKFEPEDFENFLKLLPASIEGVALRHAVEVRHESFQDPAFIALAKRYKVAVITAADCEFPQIADQTADFAYLRLQGTGEDHKAGYSDSALDTWARRLTSLAAGEIPGELACITSERKVAPRDVFAFVISGHKVANPAAAQSLIEKTS
ncbi:DUF72 domain-containing protein [Asticcacaulis sp. EMRT-3]|uniref:DUF72 domain-containing protein n=1 Tax=Asticcacaulis sp. EMRT-3 TaxID=3040349 RepID=UPI0024AF33B1|nr:DUF72 domain-containing protein [Asticcacaulis sp. EMRT-3]MDI7776153.1 DUF72 domain-containing protein [Asticcacaulis sp. EMRT-3]